jgi:methyl-accepting chemotaxis protein
MIADLKRLIRSEARRAAVPAVAPPSQPVVPRIDPRTEMMMQMRETFDLLEVDVTRLIADVVAASSATHEDMGRFAHAIKDIFGSCGELASSADGAARDVGLLASAIVELSKSSEEINRRLSEVSDFATGARQTTEEARASIDGLKSSSAEIIPIAGLISSIANRTNLLALNATIEAAHAGAAGRGFAVVATEVKSLAVETQKATEEIGRKIDDLQADSARLIGAVDSIGQLIESIWPVISAIARAVQVQTGTTAELSRTTTETSTFIARVSDRAQDIADIASSTAGLSQSANQSVQRVTLDAEKLRSRFIVFLRQTEFGTRRRFDRLPCDRVATLHHKNRVYSSRTIDVSEGGALIANSEDSGIERDARISLVIEGLGRTDARIVGRSQMGLHTEWINPPLDFTAALRGLLDKICKENADLVIAAIKAAETVSRAFEDAVTTRRLTMGELFDAEYRLIEGTDPPHYRTSAIDVLEEVLPTIQEPLLAQESRLIFAVAIDRNAWLPVHNKIYSQPQRPGEFVWNSAHSRNRRIFDDRAGLAAARNVRPSLIQTYNRDLGGGNFVMMKEVDAPIRVFGRHWGGFRMAYKL